MRQPPANLPFDHVFMLADMLGDMADVATLMATQHVMASKQCLLYADAGTFAADALELIQIVFAGQNLGNFYLALQNLPDVHMLRAFAQNGMHIGVYLPSLQSGQVETTLPLAQSPTAQAELLRKLHALLGNTFVLAEPALITDPLHYAELVAPYATQLLTIGFGGGLQQLFAAARR
jgi:hypothetical protein